MKKIAIMSAKGGVGKSSISALISCILSIDSKVLLLDFDITGPSQHAIFEPTSKVTKAEKGLNSIGISNNLYLLTMGSLVPPNTSVIWRGPKKLSMLDLFYDSIDGFDYVVVDMPPGISEEHKYIADKEFEVIFVTTSQNIALDDTMNSIEYVKSQGMSILGVIENMSGYVCEKCHTCTNVFGSKGGKQLAEYCEIPFLGSLELESKFCRLVEDGLLQNDFLNLKSSEKMKMILKTFLYK